MWPEKKKIEDEFQEGREGKNPGSGTQKKSDGGKGRGLAGRRFRIASTALLIAFSSYFLLDTFVLARSGQLSGIHQERLRPGDLRKDRDS